MTGHSRYCGINPCDCWQSSSAEWWAKDAAEWGAQAAWWMGRHGNEEEAYGAAVNAARCAHAALARAEGREEGSNG